ncbi:hypothetical protein HMN09_00688700 [Mycena chlorophos]|uniref:DUF6534 domain-containing protein n=1 Tax=Mycena chlorophos TaxID=658473 RepID=A0A8H6T073_MYCCL|nr:hypothetical protein HMN09_00688700 [Mycena chlorophos]
MSSTEVVSWGLKNFLGCGVLGLALSSIIFGITWLQVYLYYTEHSSGDRPFLKAYVAIVMILDTLNQVLVILVVYHYTVTDFGDFEALTQNTWPFFFWQALPAGIIEIMVEAFFAYRLYGMSGRKIIYLVFVGIVCVFQLAGYIGWLVIGSKSSPLPSLTAQLEPWSIIIFSSATICDLVIAVCLIHYLRKEKNAGMFRGTNRAINLLITYALNTCLLTDILNIICIIVWAKEKESMLYVLFFWVVIRSVYYFGSSRHG